MTAQPRGLRARLVIEPRRSLSPSSGGENELLYYRQLPRFTLVSSCDMHFNLDGEPIREKKLKFSVLPKHLGVAY